MTAEADPRYPIGRFALPDSLDPAQRADRIEQLERLPGEFAAALAGLDDRQLDTPYREGGWTVRQLAHHLPDSHLNAYVRCRLALTEQRPTVCAYDQDAWVRTPEIERGAVSVPLALLAALHVRWVAFLRTLGEADWQRTYLHPETGREWRLDQVLALYAWHGRHHTAHVTALRARRGWGGG